MSTIPKHALEYKAVERREPGRLRKIRQYHLQLEMSELVIELNPDQIIIIIILLLLLLLFI
jgi:hypothetical protein